MDAAPYILGMGKDSYAEQMITLAKQYNVPVVRNIKLAHKLWDEGNFMNMFPKRPMNGWLRSYAGLPLCNPMRLMNIRKKKIKKEDDHESIREF